MNEPNNLSTKSGQAQVEANMNRLNDVKKVWDGARTENNLADLVQASSIWHSTAEAEKAEVEMAKLRHVARSEALRFWVPVLASIVGTATLVGTLIFQIRQFSANVRLQSDAIRLQSEAAEDTQFREVLKTLQEPGRINATLGFPLLKTFFDSPRYRGQTREVALGLFSGMSEFEVFRPVFEAVMTRTDWTNYRDIVKVGIDLSTEYSLWDIDLEKLRKGSTPVIATPRPPLEGIPFGPPPSGQAVLRTSRGDLSVDEVQHIRDEKRKELIFCTEALAEFLRRPHPVGQDIDLSDAYLAFVNLSGADLRTANVSRAWFYHANLNKTDLAHVSQFADSRWNETAWWRAANISRALLNDLKKDWRFSPATQYAGDPPTEDEYLREVARLEAAAN